ncbi:MAG: glycoside hydrolase family 2 TIM barrel-domain containing protein [Oscillospiraceae bacterium]|nr:glycoside hydrolase family 2 TIM barrel-domain containing protein [Oscillospiraceae bacterium]
MTNIPRSEHPRPQFYRLEFENLNGEWDFEFDFSNSGEQRGMFNPDCHYSKKIIVPFCPESELSGIGYKDFMDAVWYRRVFTLKKEQLKGRVMLHFGAVDYEATTAVNGHVIGTHRGGYSSFEYDITAFVREGENVITLRARDDTRSGAQPSGKQSQSFRSAGCSYTRTTGIWQTVWLEFVPKYYIKRVDITTDYKNGAVYFEAITAGTEQEASVSAEIFYNGESVTKTETALSYGANLLCARIDSPKLWEPGKPELYDVKYTMKASGKICDEITSYFGFRTVSVKNGALNINDKKVFMRTVLDQGFYPDGIYTAPTDDALRHDIELSMSLGFNGARLHEKIFEERFLYWADKLGYIVWGEHANWGFDLSYPENIKYFLSEWTEALERDYNHPSIIGWCPFNETWDNNHRAQDKEMISLVYHQTRAIDKTRPVIDVSGGYHTEDTDFYDIHDYEQRIDVWAERYGRIEPGKIYDPLASRQYSCGQPYWISEYGGTWWAPGRKDGWGYGNAPKSEEELAERYYGLTTTLLKQENICGFCYTQLTDVEQEQNGLYSYDRKPKFSDETYKKIREANTYPAELEKKQDSTEK